MNFSAASQRFSAVVALVMMVSMPLAVSAGPGDTAKAGSVAPFYPVKINSLESKGLFSSEPLKITVYVLEAKTGGIMTPGAVFAPACGGLMTRDGQSIKPWYRRMAQNLRRKGITSVLVDGFNPRGHKEICSQRLDSRTITEITRMEDSLAGLRYLRSRADIDGEAIFLFTWGGAGGFQTMNKRPADIGGGFTAAVMFYPNCGTVDEAISPYGPIQVFIGE